MGFPIATLDSPYTAYIAYTRTGLIRIGEGRQGSTTPFGY